MNITVSKKTAMRLKEAGWDRECFFVYLEYDEVLKIAEIDGVSLHELEECIEAPTAQELIDALPKKILKDKCEYKLSIYYDDLFDKNEVIVLYDTPRGEKLDPMRDDEGYVIAGHSRENLAEAIDELWRELKKNKLI